MTSKSFNNLLADALEFEVQPIRNNPAGKYGIFGVKSKACHDVFESSREAVVNLGIHYNRYSSAESACVRGMKRRRLKNKNS